MDATDNIESALAAEKLPAVIKSKSEPKVSKMKDSITVVFSKETPKGIEVYEHKFSASLETAYRRKLDQDKTALKTVKVVKVIS